MQRSRRPKDEEEAREIEEYPQEMNMLTDSEQRVREDNYAEKERAYLTEMHYQRDNQFEHTPRTTNETDTRVSHGMETRRPGRSRHSTDEGESKPSSSAMRRNTDEEQSVEVGNYRVHDGTDDISAQAELQFQPRVHDEAEPPAVTTNPTRNQAASSGVRPGAVAISGPGSNQNEEDTIGSAIEVGTAYAVPVQGNDVYEELRELREYRERQEEMQRRPVVLGTPLSQQAGATSSNNVETPRREDDEEEAVPSRQESNRGKHCYEASSTKRRCFLVGGLVTVVAIVVAVIVAAVVAGSSKESGGVDSSTSGTQSTPGPTSSTLQPSGLMPSVFPNPPSDLPSTSPASPPSVTTLPPTPPPTMMPPSKLPLPTAQPTFRPPPLPTPNPTIAATFASLEDLIVSVSFDNGASLQDGSSPQSRALSWLQGNANLQQYPDWRKIQRYALATLYYSTNGEDWTWSTDWLTDVDECDWVSGFPSLCHDGEHVSRFGRSSINMSGSIPPELGLLSYLRDVRFYGNEIEGTIPSEVGLLSNVDLFWLYDNRLEGTIPTEVGDMSNMSWFAVNANSLVGTIPDIFESMSTLIT